MSGSAVLNQKVTAQAKDLLQEQLSNLSTRLFETGKRSPGAGSDLES